MELTFFHPEFEQEVREMLNIFDRAVTDVDAQEATELDLTNFDFKKEDDETLFYFKNLNSLYITTGERDASFWDHFPKLECLDWECWGDGIDFKSFSNMYNLKQLLISGGDLSGMTLKNLSALIPLRDLCTLSLHEFGAVDLAPLEKMDQIKDLSVMYSYEVENISAIGTMTQLDHLMLCGLLVEDLNFLDTLPDSVELDMCGIEVKDVGSIDVKKWKRFPNRDICEIEVRDPYWRYIDLSELRE